MILNKVVTKISRTIDNEKKKAETKKSLRTLMNSGPAQDICEMAQVLYHVAENKRWDKLDLDIFGQVEEIAERYAASTASVAFKDFGAGGADDDKQKDEMEKGTIIERKVADIFQSAATKPKWGKLMYQVVRAFKPVHCLELGTSLGISAAYQILALKRNGFGKLVTIEGAKPIAQLATQSLKSLQYDGFQVHEGKFVNVLPNVLNKDKPLGLVFIDGHHDERATEEYFDMIYPYLNEQAIVIFDDINWSTGMQAVWKLICEDKRINFTFDLQNWGICLIDKNIASIENGYFKAYI